jgi:hypothetical protein
MTDAHDEKADGQIYRGLQAAARLKLVRMNRPVPAGEIDPHAVLTQEEIDRAITEAQHSDVPYQAANTRLIAFSP